MSNITPVIGKSYHLKWAYKNKRFILLDIIGDSCRLKSLNRNIVRAKITDLIEVNESYQISNVELIKANDYKPTNPKIGNYYTFKNATSGSSFKLIAINGEYCTLESSKGKRFVTDLSSLRITKLTLDRSR